MVLVLTSYEGLSFRPVELLDSGTIWNWAYDMQVTACNSSIDATGGEYRLNYRGVITRIVEDTVAAFIDVDIPR